jgi:hypothetical protein
MNGTDGVLVIGSYDEGVDVAIRLGPLPDSRSVSLVFHTRPRRDGIVRAFIDHVGPPARTELDRVARIVYEAEAARRGRQDHP